MAHPLDKSYRFDTAKQWRAGAFDNFEVVEAALQAPLRFGFDPLDDTAQADRGAVPAIDPCGRLHWLRPASGELVRQGDSGAEELGTLVDGRGATMLVIGAEIIWVLAEDVVRRYVNGSLELLGAIEAPSGRTILAIAGDEHDGLWLLEGGTGSAVLTHVDSWGCPTARKISIEETLRRATLAASPDGASLVVLDPENPRGSSRNACGRVVRWRLFVFEACPLRRKGEFGFEALDGGVPDLIAIDRNKRIHVVSSAKQGPILTVSLAGERIAERLAPVPRSWWPLSALVADGKLLVAGNGGLAWLPLTAVSADESENFVSVFITPTLISPDGARRGWNRADIDALLPEGATLRISYVATRSPTKIAEVEGVLDDEALTPVARYAALAPLLQWPEPETIYSKGAEGGERFRFLLAGVTETHLWLRLEFYTPPGRQPPRLEALRVHYPERSYLEDLPAIYSEDTNAARQLRRFLAPFEALFGDLDDAITALAGKIDPVTAPDEWHAFLLRWLGFPATQDLSWATQRRLLDEAPELLARRGTMAALVRVLQILTGGRASVEDGSLAPAPWILPGGNGAPRGPRLGRETRIVAQDPPPFRLGAGVKLGATPLGQGCTDIERALMKDACLLRIRVGIDPLLRDRLMPVIRAFLAVFVPVHSCIDLIEVPAVHFSTAFRLDANLALAGDDEGDSGAGARLTDGCGARLGSATDLGCWHLPRPELPIGVLDRTATFDSDVRLT